jgi:hypothetical protein
MSLTALNFGDPPSDLAVLSVFSNGLRELRGSRDPGIDYEDLNVSGLSNMTRLETLHILGNYWTTVKGVSALQALPSLQHLTLGGHPASMTFLSQLTSLTSLHVDYWHRIDCRAIAALSGLVELEVNGSESEELRSLDGLQRLTMLTRLHIYQPHEPLDIQALSGLTQLRALLMSTQTHKSLHPLSGLTSHRDLDLTVTVTVPAGGAPLIDLRPLSGLVQLTRLEVRAWDIEVDLSSLSWLTNLCRLKVVCKGAHHLQALVGLSGLPPLRVKAHPGGCLLCHD